MSRPQSALIVDDEAHVRVYLRMLLKQLGVETLLEAGNGEDALKLFREHRPKLVLLDIVMPGQSGPNLMKEILSIDKEAHVIVVTSQVGLKTVQEMHSLGALAYILKHTPRDQMEKMLMDALDSLEAGV